MAATATVGTPTTHDGGWTRAAGLAGAAFALAVIAQNIWSGAVAVLPAADAGPDEIVEAFADHGDAVGIQVGWVVVNLVLIGLFLAGIAQRVEGAAPVPSRLGTLGGTLLMAFFPLANVPLVVLAIGGGDLAGEPALVDALWHTHGALFALAGFALGLALLGFSLASVAAGLVPSWFRIVGPLGAGLIILSSVPVKQAAEGHAGLTFGLLGFAAWLLFLLVSGRSLWREGSAS